MKHTIIGIVLAGLAGSAGAHDGISYDHHYDSECKDADGFYEVSRCHHGRIRFHDHDHDDYGCHEMTDAWNTFLGSNFALKKILESDMELPPPSRKAMEGLMDQYHEAARDYGALVQHVCW